MNEHNKEYETDILMSYYYIERKMIYLLYTYLKNIYRRAYESNYRTNFRIKNRSSCCSK